MAYPKPVHQYLCERFSADDLRLFLAMHFPSVVPGLPDLRVGLEQYVFAAVQRLQQFGYLDAAFFTALGEARPHDAALRTAAVAYLGSDPFPVGGPGATGGSKHAFLILMACPADQDALDLKSEAATIEDQLGLGALRDRFNLVWGWDVSGDQVLDLIADHKPQWIHFAGHGGRDGALIVVGAGRTTARISYDALARYLGALRQPPRCVALNACFSGLATAPLTAHVDAVVGMRDEISDEAALVFSRRLYRSLGGGRDLQESFGLARANLGTLTPPCDGLPQLSCRPGVDPTTIRF